MNIDRLLTVRDYPQTLDMSTVACIAGWSPCPRSVGLQTSPTKA